jgi:hypothetical protein
LKVYLHNFSKSQNSRNQGFSFYFSWWQKDPDPDPYLWLVDPDPGAGGPKTYGSGFGTLVQTREKFWIRHKFPDLELWWLGTDWLPELDADLEAVAAEVDISLAFVKLQAAGIAQLSHHPAEYISFLCFTF